jgi:hypothetical protein
MTAVYAAAYGIYRDLGWAPLKLRAGTKFPPPVGFTGHNGVDPSGADCHAWAEEEPGGNVAIRLPAGVMGFDVDNHSDKPGGQTMEDRAGRWGALPYSPRSTSRQEDGDTVSGIWLYRIPPGIELVDNLPGVDIIQRHHRCVVCWPSIHPEGRQYRWYGIDGGELAAPPALGDIPELPAAWLEGLRKSVAHSDTGIGAEAPYNVSAAITEGEMSRRVAFKLSQAMSEVFGSECRHDSIRDRVLGLLRCGKQGEPGVKVALQALREAFVNKVGPDRPGGREGAVSEFNDFVNGSRVRELLAEPGYDEWTHSEPPPDTDEHYAGEYQGDERTDQRPDEPTTWEAIDLGPYLRGEVERPQPSIGFARSDGLKLIYPGREHAVLGETESGKTWYALACVAVELRLGHRVVYIHYEEPDPGSTIERLRLIGVSDADIRNLLTFVAPTRALTREWLAPLVNPPPSLVVHDGVNEAMALHGAEIFGVDGTSEFRRRLVAPFRSVGAASLACDHLPKGADSSSRDAYGSVHKGNALDGSRIMLENVEPFGRGMRGRSNVYVTKDRPGYLRAHGKASKTPGKTFMGTLVVDDTDTPDFVEFFAPKDDEGAAGVVTSAELADIVYDVIHALPDHRVMSTDLLFAEIRKAGQRFRQTAIRDVVADLIVGGRLVELLGKRGARGYETVSTSSQSL